MIWLLLSLAAAQDDVTTWGGCGLVKPFEGTPSLDLSQRAALDNATLLGAVAVAERRLLPLMHEYREDDSNVGVFLYEANNIGGVARVPGTVEGGNCPAEQALGIVDLTSSSFGLAYSTDYFGVFYNASVSTQAVYTGWQSRAGFDTLNSVAGVFYGIAAPFMSPDSVEGDSSSASWDYVVGGELKGGTIAARGAYVGSGGYYLQAHEKFTGSFIGVAGDEVGELSIDRLAYLRGGIERFGLEQVRDEIGMTSVFARSLRLPTPAARQNANLPADNLATAHFAQQGVARYFDLQGAYAWKPTPLFHELVVGVHTPEFHLPATAREDEEWSYGGHIGFTELPAFPYLNATGGRRLTFRAQALYAISDRGGISAMGAKLRVNDPEILTLFPYAQDSVAVTAYISFGGE